MDVPMAKQLHHLPSNWFQGKHKGKNIVLQSHHQVSLNEAWGMDIITYTTVLSIVGDFK